MKVKQWKEIQTGYCTNAPIKGLGESLWDQSSSLWNWILQNFKQGHLKIGFSYNIGAMSKWPPHENWIFDIGCPCTLDSLPIDRIEFQ